MSRVIRILFFIAIAAYVSNGCGVTTHNVISNIAFEKISGDSTINYKDIIGNNLNYFQTGSAFPDWGYSCPLGEFNSTLADILHNASETAHWINFMKTGISYLNSTYQRPWNADAQHLLAFLLGVVSHSVADILWHDIGIIGATRQGFIQALCNSDFNCSGADYTSDTHTLADAGGEFVNAKFHDLSFIKQDWELPFQDLVNIYGLMGIDLTEFELGLCFAELGIEIDFIRDINPDILYPVFATQSPFLVNSMNDWWLGGIQSMAFWTQNCWTGIVEFLDTGDLNSVCGIYRDSAYSNSSFDRVKFYQRKRQYMRSIIDSYEHQTEVKAHKHRSHQVPHTNSGVISSTDTKCVTNFVNKIDSAFDGSMFGYSLDLSDDDILIGAPFDTQNQGSISLIPLNHTEATARRRSRYLNQKGKKNDDSRFGSNVKFIDINNDDVYEVVVNEPGHNNFMGRTHIFLSTNDTIDYNNPIIIEHIGDSWGSIVSLANGDFNGDGVDDLLMGFSQYRSGSNLEIGTIVVVLASANWTSGDHVVCDNLKCNHSLVMVKNVGSVFWEQAGSALKALRFNNRSYVLVSSPTFNVGQGSIGRVACWDLINDKIVWEVYGKALNSGFGLSLDSDDTNVYIGAPTADPLTEGFIAGSVFVYRLIDLFNGKTDPVTSVDGVESFGRFGYAVAVSNGTLYVSAPFTKDISGTIYAYDVNQFDLSGCYSVDAKHHTALGYSLKVKDGLIYAGAPYQDNFRGGLYTFSV